MPITFITMMTGWLAICGIPIWAGFFSKDEILYKTFAAQGMGDWSFFLWIVGLLTAVMTAAYMTRMMWMTFFGEERFHEPIHEELPVVDNLDEASRAEENAFATGDAADAVVPHSDPHAWMHADADEQAAHDDDDDVEEHHHLPSDFHPHESPWTMTVPLIVLAILSTFGGLVGIPYAVSSLVGAGDINAFEHILEPIIAKKGEHTAIETPGHSAEKKVSHSAENEPKAEKAGAKEENHDAHSPEEIRTERLLALLSVALAIGGIGLGIFFFGKTPLRKLPKILQDKWRLDEFYNGYIVDPITNISREGLWKGFDVGLIDGIVNGAGHFVQAIGSAVRKIQVGYVRSYAAFILFGALIVIGYFIYYGFKLIS